MQPRLKGKVALVTGATQGIGASIASLFLEHGAHVVINTLRHDGVAKAFMESLGSQGYLFQADITHPEEVNAMVEATLKRFGRLDVLVNNAGITPTHDPLDLQDEDWKRCMSVDVEGAWHCSQAVLPHMLKQEKGDIINIASVHGHKIIPGFFPYPVAKHALIGLTRALALQYAAQGVRVNSISPGFIVTPMTETALQKAADPEAMRRKQAELLPCQRLGDPQEVAYTALFLASDEARFINATDILIDGGRSHLYHEELS